MLAADPYEACPEGPPSMARMMDSAIVSAGCALYEDAARSDEAAFGEVGIGAVELVAVELGDVRPGAALPEESQAALGSPVREVCGPAAGSVSN